MKIKIITIISLAFCVLSTFSQQKYTAYDKVPSVNSMAKPSYNKNYPEWAKMLYKYPINFYEINEKFNLYMHKNPGTKNEIVRYFKIWKPALEPFVLDDGTIKLPNFKELFIDDKKQISSKVNSSKKTALVDNSDWTFWGPKVTIWRTPSGGVAPWQANVYSFDVAASNNNILYSGTETGFINKTIDNGLTWQPCALNYKFGAGILAIAIDPTNPDIVYASSNSQLHKTSDGGITWSAKAFFKSSRLIIDHNTPSKIIAAAETGIYISTDFGETWTQKFNSETWDVAIKPNNPNIIYGISITGNNFSLVISTDGGNNFSADPNFPTNIENKSGGLLAVTPANPEIVYLSMLAQDTAAGTNFPLVYKGTNTTGTYNWAFLKKGFERTAGGSLGQMSNGQGYFDFVLAVSPDDENLLFWGTTNLFKSTDGGLNYTSVGGYNGPFGIHPDMQDIKMLAGSKMWISTDGGINYSTDNFVNTDNFSPRIQGLQGSQMWGFDQGWNDDIVVGGRYHNGNTALADTYNGKALRLGGGESPTGWIIHALPRQATFKDINGGFTTSIPLTIDENVPNKQYAFSKLPNNKVKNRGNLLEHPNYQSVLYVGEGNGFWKSDDTGTTWSLLHDFGNTVRFIDISHKNPNVLYADIDGLGFHKSEDGGNTWVSKNTGITSSWYGKLHFVISPYNENTIYLCPQKTAASWQGKILKSTDGGSTWADWSGSLPTTKFTKVLGIQPTNANQDLVYLFTVANNSGSNDIGEVFYRKQNMTDWEVFSNTDDYPVNMKPIFAQPFYRDSKIRVAGNNGVWESPLAEPNFNPPYITPWVGSPIVDCSAKTIYLDDHSMLDHQNVSWEWNITPTPEYISDANIRNPEVILGSVGTFSFTLKVTKNGQEYTSQSVNVEVQSECADLGNCDNKPAIVRYDFEDNILNNGTLGSEADLELDIQSSNTGSTSFVAGKYGKAYNFDGTNTLTTAIPGWTGITEDKPRTITAWINVPSIGSNLPILNMGEKSGGKRYTLKLNTAGQLRVEVEGSGFSGSTALETDTWIHVAISFNPGINTGTLKDNILYVNGVEYGTSTSTNTFSTSARRILVGAQMGSGGAVFPFTGKMDDLRIYDCALSESQIQEIMSGQTLNTDKILKSEIKGFPIPTDGMFNISIPNKGKYNYKIYSQLGQIVKKGILKGTYSSYKLDLSDLNKGVYFLKMINDGGIVYKIKVVKK